MIADLAGKAALFVEQGGFCMYPLILATLILWYALGYRLAVLKRGNTRSVRALVDKRRQGYDKEPSGIIDSAVAAALAIAAEPHRDLRKALDGAFVDYRRAVGRCARLVRSIVAAAPLLGLLGTVTGMIEMFDSLGDNNLYSQSGGVAAGIAEALLTTEMGLVVAVPGLVVGRMLDRRQSMLERELNQIADILCAEKGGARR